MDLKKMKLSLSDVEPPAGLTTWQQALWYDAKGDWETSHQLIQDLTDKNAAWIHAYLHRKEGDAFNAKYWYNRASRPVPAASLEDEWETLVTSID